MQLKFIFPVLILLSASIACAYDATFNFTQQYPELVSGWKIKAGPTKGGPYPIVIDCKKPIPNVDKSYDCVGTNLVANPIYAIAVNYDSAGKESASSTEATMTLTVPEPSELKIVVTIRTVPSFTQRGNIIARTSVRQERVPVDTVVDTKPIAYWNSKTRQYISQTTIAM